jgi:hypothetical protein
LVRETPTPDLYNISRTFPRIENTSFIKLNRYEALGRWFGEQHPRRVQRRTRACAFVIGNGKE